MCSDKHLPDFQMGKSIKLNIYSLGYLPGGRICHIELCLSARGDHMYISTHVFVSVRIIFLK